MEPEQHRISILSVEDDKTMREMFRTIINRKFPDNPLYLGENGDQGIELFRAYNPQIVITDIIMPGMDGVEMASIIKKIEPKVKLIVITGYDNNYYHEKFSNIGADAFITKPIDIKKLFYAIEICIAEIRTQGNRCRQ